MTVWPLVERELRSSARQRFTYALRVISPAALLVVSMLFALDNGFRQRLGGYLFSLLHLALFAAIWVFVPFLTADCISRERREGTLGLLFLTRLGAGDIVLAKSLAHGLRALTMWLAVLPILTIPFLLGGVGWREALLSICVNFGSICLALAAGLLGSVLSRVWSRILAWVACLSLIFCTCFVVVHFVLVLECIGGGFLRRALREPLLHFLPVCFALATDTDATWSAAASLSNAQKLRWVEGAALSAAGGALFLWLMICLAAWRVGRSWREESSSSRLQWFFRTFCEPRFFRRIFQRWMRRKLDLNPIGWLEQRSWTGRLVTWIWLGLVMFFSCAALLDPDVLGYSGGATHFMAGAMGISLALSAAGSLRRERESGVLELLLVSPLGENRIISGRIRGLWTQFLPGAAFFIAIWVYVYSLVPAYTGYNVWSSYARSGFIFFAASSFASVPVIGLYFSLRCQSFPTAFLLTVIAALLAPIVLANIAGWCWWLYFGEIPYDWEMLPSTGSALWQLLLAGIFWRALLRLLRKRSYRLRTS